MSDGFLTLERQKELVSDIPAEQRGAYLQSIADFGLKVEGLNAESPSGQFYTTESQKELIDGLSPERQAHLIKRLAQDNELEGLNRETSPLAAVQNLPGSALDAVKGVFEVLSNPGQTLDAMSSSAKGLMRKLAMLPMSESRRASLGVAETTLDEQAFDSLAKFYQQRFGSVEKALETIERDPAGAGSDIAAGLGLVAGGAGAIVTKGGKASVAIRQIQKASRLADPTLAAVKGTEKLLGKIFDTMGVKLAQSGLGLTGAQAKNIAKESFLGVNPGKAFNELGVVQRLVRSGKTPHLVNVKDELIRTKQRSKAAVDGQLAQVQGTFKSPVVPKILDELQKEINKIPAQNRGERFNELQKQLTSSSVKHAGEGLTVTELNGLKRQLDDMVAPYKKGGEAKDAARLNNLADLRRSLRRLIEQKAAAAGFKDIQRLNRTTQFASSLIDMTNDTILVGPQKRGILEAMTAAGGITGFAATGDPSFLIKTGLIIGGLELVRTPIFRMTMAHVLNGLGDQEVASLQKAIKAGRATPTVRRVLKEMQLVFPELRLAGVTKQRVSDTKRQEETEQLFKELGPEIGQILGARK